MNVDVAKFKVEKVSELLWKLYVFQQLAVDSVIKTVSMFYLEINPICKV